MLSTAGTERLNCASRQVVSDTWRATFDIDNKKLQGYVTVSLRDLI